MPKNPANTPPRRLLVNDAKMIVKMPSRLLDAARASASARGMELPELVRAMLALICDAKPGERIGTYAEIGDGSGLIQIVARHPQL